MSGLHRSALILVRKETPFKMHGCIYGVNLVGQALRHEVDHPYIIPLLLAFEHDRVYGLIHIG